MLRAMAVATALVALPAGADAAWRDGGPSFAVLGAERAEPGDTCERSLRARIDVTVTDRHGVAYAAVDLGAADVRPAVSDRTRTWLWLPDDARGARAYRWRYEDRAATRLRQTLPLVVDVAAGAGPVEMTVTAKDGAGNLTVRSLAVLPAACS